MVGQVTPVERRRVRHLLLALTDDADVLTGLDALMTGIGTVVPVVVEGAGAPGAVIDPTGQIADRYGIGPTGLALIRPDGYLGYLSPATYPAALETYLADRLHVRADDTGPGLARAQVTAPVC